MTTKKTTAKEPEPTGPPANIMFVGRDVTLDKTDAKGQAIVLAAEPLKRINNGESVLRLPDAETQSAGFYHDDAATITRLYPNLYKTIIAKGE